MGSGKLDLGSDRLELESERFDLGSDRPRGLVWGLKTGGGTEKKKKEEKFPSCESPLTPIDNTSIPLDFNHLMRD